MLCLLYMTRKAGMHAVNVSGTVLKTSYQHLATLVTKVRSLPSCIETPNMIAMNTNTRIVLMDDHHLKP